MQIILNGDDVDAVTDVLVADLVTGLSDRSDGIAVALNSEVVPRSAWRTTVVRSGDRVDVVTAVQGG